MNAKLVSSAAEMAEKVRERTRCGVAATCTSVLPPRFQEPCHRQRKGATTDCRDRDLGIVQGFPYQGWQMCLHRPCQQDGDGVDLVPILGFAERPRCPRHDDEISVVWVQGGCCAQNEAT